jgi:multiple sugar transport system ATP-binding protein
VTPKPSGDVLLGIRPEDIYNASGPYLPEKVSELNARVDVVEPMGNEIYLYADLEGHEVIARLTQQGQIEPDSTIRLAIDVSKVHLFDGNTGERL